MFGPPGLSHSEAKNVILQNLEVLLYILMTVYMTGSLINLGSQKKGVFDFLMEIYILDIYFYDNLIIFLIIQLFLPLNCI